ncbi:MAG: alpha/beta hydrolase family esterase [Flavobacteriaceae bacterium]|jgi:poly(3-hydroxybutyrate) depolymerase
MKQFNLLSFLILLVCCSGSDNSSDNTTTQDEVFFVSQSIGGVQVQREVLLHLPNNFDSTQTYPVVIAFHGNGGQNNSWFNQLSQFVDIGEFIGVYPQGYLNSWNLGAEASTADEVYFFNQIMAKLETYSFFDASKVYGIGVSNGSALINKLGIETAHFSAIAALASQLIIGTIPNNSTSPVAVYQMCGTLDNIIPYGGGMSVVGHHFLSASDSALSWVNAFNCTTEPIVEMLGDDEILIYEDCESGKEIRFHSVNNAGHNLNQPNTPNFYGPVWEFLKRF